MDSVTWEWVKRNKLITAIILVVLVYLLPYLYRAFFLTKTELLSLDLSRNQGSYGTNIGPAGAPASSFGTFSYPISGGGTEYAPQPDADNRLVVSESNVSLLVKDVPSVRDKILEYTNANEGYMVSSHTSNPQDAPTATITIRIPAGKLTETLDYLQSLSIKVVSENLNGTDVTDRYVDIQKRIDQVGRSLAKVESLLEGATQISDITNLTQQVLNYQNQIDSLRGQQEVLEKNAQLAKLTIYLSTDEIALPYTPSETFRPAIIFKLAVRSLVGTLRGLAAIAIWLVVYSVIWVPAVIIFRFVRRRIRQKISNPSLKK